MPTLSEILVYPVKALDPIRPAAVSVSSVGGLQHDRVYAIKNDNGEYIHGKRTASVHRLDTKYDPETGEFSVRVHDTDQQYDCVLDDERAGLERWLSEFFGQEVNLRAGVGGSQTDSAVFTEAGDTGPTVISEATLKKVASWYDDISPEEMCLRLRPNLVVSGVGPFWEERLVVKEGCRLRVGDTALIGVEPVPRCAVPTRDPTTGIATSDFRETVIRKRAETLPEWANRAVFDGNLFSLAVGTRIPEPERNGEFAVGDDVGLSSV